MIPPVGMGDEIVLEIGAGRDLRDLTRSLRQGTIDIDGIVASRLGESRTVRFLPKNPEEAMLLLDDAGIEFRQNRVLTVPVQDPPKDLDELVSKLKEAGLEADSVYPTMARERGPTLALHVDEPERARLVLQG